MYAVLYRLAFHTETLPFHADYISGLIHGLQQCFLQRQQLLRTHLTHLLYDSQPLPREKATTIFFLVVTGFVQKTKAFPTNTAAATNTPYTHTSYDT